MKKNEMVLGLLSGSVFLWGLQALADSGVPVVVPSNLPAAITGLQHITSLIPSSLSMTMIAIIGFVIELLMRLVPSVKPRSLFILASVGLKAVSDFCVKISGLLDQVVQNLTQ